MKRLFFLAGFIFISIALSAQVLNPVTWNVSSKKIKDKTFEVRMTANLEKGWHIYSQTTPDGGPVPTSVEFVKNPLVNLQGKVKEVGKLEQRHEEIFGVDVKQFSNKVDFVQLVTLKSPIKTSANVSVEYMVCNDKQCLPPVTKKFSIALNN
ncbi:MAG: protein-disulfide reductase DsbD domain-containing protein [Ginsengibacter sp.]